ncbi:hypothetical protein YSA_09503 [Pseudomonas putida ND6]|uniref:Uncharacterized protein n=1 Tax=Pseudomonas putida ND6 TaxID=231023 RepID=I3V2E7_PSEPU|nr:hypothetical protein YSA_09503 [Pseudomonas putida ND6]
MIGTGLSQQKMKRRGAGVRTPGAIQAGNSEPVDWE